MGIVEFSSLLFPKEYQENFFEKIFGIFHFYSYLCSAVPVRPSPRLFDAGDDPGFFVFAKVHKYFDSDNKKAFFFAFFVISLTLKHFSIIPCFCQKKSVSLQKKSCTRQFESKLSLRSLA
ncbi:hypothetical protein KUA50_013240 [Segatella hominis]|uniref:hypothetical protein n=1 Tax=Segatella hominis TaxID=2518605 RepID=UPI00294DDDE7|nr:hypothetical protein [Segatella hominis]WOZ80986.1 hypothetical protein KUA50_013240 [Segatella hominis]